MNSLIYWGTWFFSSVTSICSLCRRDSQVFVRSRYYTDSSPLPSFASLMSWIFTPVCSRYSENTSFLYQSVNAVNSNQKFEESLSNKAK